MGSSTLFLHIGAPKTGTTYIQDMLWGNKDLLGESQVLVPGRRRYARVQAVRDLLDWEPGADVQLPRSWRRLADEISGWRGRSAILSVEFLSWATEGQARALCTSVGGRGVKVILTARDLTSLVPSLWQTSVRQGRTWTLHEYAAGVAEVSRASEAADHFWTREDFGSIIARWAKVVGIENVTVVTLPAAGSDPAELWRRFCAATELEPNDWRVEEASHESLGAASAEILRRVNATIAVRGLDEDGYRRSVNGALSRRALAPRREAEPRLSLPGEHREWAERESQRVIAEIAATGARVIGDLDELRPPTFLTAAVAPEQLAAEDLLSAAVDGLAGLAVEYSKQRRALEELKNDRASEPSD